MKEFAGAIALKAVAMAIVVLAIVHTHLSTFAQALIIAICSASITGVFVVAAAWITVRLQKPLHDEMRATHRTVDKISDAQNTTDE